MNNSKSIKIRKTSGNLPKKLSGMAKDKIANKNNVPKITSKTFPILFKFIEVTD
jgi:hypothetical protein